MQRKIRTLIQQQWAGLIALFLVLSGGTAYATHETILSSDIQDSEVKNADLGAGAVTGLKVLGSSLDGSDIKGSSLDGSDIAFNSLTSSDVGTGAVGSSEVADKSLGTADFATSIPATSVLRGGSGQGIPDANDTTFNYTSEDYDTASMHSTSSNISRLTAPVTGIYEVEADVDFDANSSGFRSASLDHSAHGGIDSERFFPSAVPSGRVTLELSEVARFAAGEYVEVVARQTSGGTLLATSGVTMTWLAPGP